MDTPTLDRSLRTELRAIQWFTLTHAAGLLGFVLLMGGFLWYLHSLEREQQRQTLYRDIEWSQQSIRLRLREQQEQVALIARHPLLLSDAATRREAADKILAPHPEIAYLALIDVDRQVQWLTAAAGIPSVANRAPGKVVDDSAGFGSFHEARDGMRPTYSPPFLGDDNGLLVELHWPLERDGQFAGTLVAGYSLHRLLTVQLSPEVRERYQVALTDQGGGILVSSSPRRIHEANLSYEMPLDPPGRGVRLRASVFDERPRLIERSMMLAVVGLAIASLVSLILLWRHSHRRLRAEVERDRIFRLSGDLMCVTDELGRFTRVNPAFDLLFGEPAQRRTLVDLAHPYERPIVAKALAQAARPGGGAADFEARFEHQDGWRWLQWSLRSDPEASTPALYGVAHDVTERKRAETALAAETSFRQAMEDSMLTGMRAFDMEGRVLYVNRAFCDMTGYRSEELIGTSAPYPHWPPDDYPAQLRNLEMVLSGQAPASGLEVRVHRRDGSSFDARMYVSPLVDRDGRQTGWMSSITDITEPKRTRNALAAAHERFTTVLDELEAAVWVLSAPATEPLFANRAFREMFPVQAHANLALASAAARGETAMPQVCHLPELGRWLEVRSRSIRWVDGAQVWMFMANDITRQREAEERHREQERELGRTSRLVTMGEMASSLAHELNQPLSAIANYCMGLAARIRTRTQRDESVDPKEALEVLERTSAQAQRAGMVIRRIREFVKRSEPERRHCEVQAIVAEAVGLAEIEARRLGVQIEVAIPNALPPLVADPILIEQVLLNLIRNGLEALEAASRRRLEVRVMHEEAGFAFAVTDTGAGLSPGAAEKLFEPFFTTKREGMGMGLNICRSIIESHQGRLWVEANPEGGSCFRFTLPLVDADVVAEAV